MTDSNVWFYDTEDTQSQASAKLAKQLRKTLAKAYIEHHPGKKVDKKWLHAESGLFQIGFEMGVEWLQKQYERETLENRSLTNSLD